MSNKEPQRLSRTNAIKIVAIFSDCLHLLYKEAGITIPVDSFDPDVEATRLIEALKGV